jgi:hypothetical protein
MKEKIIEHGDFKIAVQSDRIYFTVTRPLPNIEGGKTVTSQYFSRADFEDLKNAICDAYNVKVEDI